ncbi:glycosyltransferase [Companilactobacillus zhachilii]|uniref:Glycosyltransferase n=1 Tax=Companilactobacillus zhachilii TaxID=2304606 RepID=A0A386PV18_9LACO|nr:glycosyltransferase [Companilactobacillus zhachilii]AYE39028.1 glycosyltransferase [Companilactobacillus zhachilii]
MKKQIIILVPYMTGFGGTETVITNLFTEYNKSKHNSYDLKLISIGGFDNGAWQDNITDKKIISLNSIRFIRNIQYILFLPILIFLELNKSKNIKAVVSTNPIIWAIAFWIKNIFGMKYDVVSWYHYSPKRKPIKRLLLKSADKYMAISSGVAGQFRDLGIIKEKIKLIYNPVIENERVVMRTNHIAPCKFIYVGRIMLDGQKNIRTLFNCLSKVSGNWNLDMFGAGDISEVMDFAKEKSISKKINIKGFKKNIWDEITSADCLVLTSKYEGFGMVLAEAISVGIPVLSVDCDSGPSDIITNDNGILVEQDDIKGLISSLQKFVNRDYDFSDYGKIKSSISQFYGNHYLKAFINAL